MRYKVDMQSIQVMKVLTLASQHISSLDEKTNKKAPPMKIHQQKINGERNNSSGLIVIIFSWKCCVKHDSKDQLSVVCLCNI